MSNTLSHTDKNGQANMVDVSNKEITTRIARATARICMQKETLQQVIDNSMKKGDVLSVARIAGIQAAKKCGDLIPLCHPLMLSKVSVDFEIDSSNNCINVNTLCKLNAQTGVEMEALTAASIAALTIYDMCKAIDMSMTVENICVIEKKGGKRDHYLREERLREEKLREEQNLSGEKPCD